MQRYRTNLIVAIVSLCITLAAIEVALRQFYEPVEPLQLGEIVDWNSSDYVTHLPRNNKLGFREDELSDAVLADDTVRILFLGDSFTFGSGVPDGADRFSDLVESRLNSELPGNYHIFNAGKRGTEPHDWIGYLKELYPVYKPDYVLAIFFLRDGTPVCTSLRCYEPIIADLKAKYTHNLFYEYSYLGKLIGTTLVKQAFSNYYNSLLLNAYFGSEEETTQWRLEQQALLEIQAFCRQNDLDFHLVIFPLLFRLDKNYPFQTVEQEISRFANEAGMAVYSLTPGFLGQVDSTLWVSANDQHPNEKGHRIAAETLFPYVKQVLTDSDAE